MVVVFIVLVFEGCIVFVIGGFWGIGCEVLFYFVVFGVCVVVNYVINLVKVEEFVVEFVLCGFCVVVVCVDVFDLVVVCVFFDCVEEVFGFLFYVVVVCVGIMDVKYFVLVDIVVEDFDVMFVVNMCGKFLVCWEVVWCIFFNSGGCIMMFLFMMVVVLLLGYVVYVVFNVVVEVMMSVLVKEVVVKGIMVNVVVLGFVCMEFFFVGKDEVFLESMKNFMGMVEMMDMVFVVVFLVSEVLGWVNG